MSKLLKFSRDTLNIILMFISWRVILLLISIFSINFIPLAFTDRFLGGGPIFFKINPYLFSWANFDGEHYLSIAIFGYKNLEQAFFPMYPLLISIFAKPFSTELLSSLINSTIVGLIISNISFLLSLLLLFNLLRIDYSRKIVYLTLTFILVFPTSFYFGAVYNESLFLLLCVLSFLNARKGRWFWAAFFGFLSSTTRIFGLLIFPALLIEAYQQRANLSKVVWIFLIPSGLGLYMLYQYFTVGDALAFYHLQKLVGEQHQSELTLLPQVYYRYVKMLLTTDKFNPIYQTVLLEFIVGITFFGLPLYGYLKKVRLSYILYALMGFLLPSVQGSFSSVPRYVIVFFPSFLILALIVDKFRIIKCLLLIIFIIFLIIETSLFLRGYWVA